MATTQPVRPLAALDQEMPPHVSMTADVWRRFARNRLSLVGLAIVALLVVCAVFASHLSSYDPNNIDMNIVGTPQQPSWQHLFGTDADGRDYFTRMLFGAASLEVGFSAMLAAITFGDLRRTRRLRAGWTHR